MISLKPSNLSGVLHPLLFSMRTNGYHYSGLILEEENAVPGCQAEREKWNAFQRWDSLVSDHANNSHSLKQRGKEKEVRKPNKTNYQIPKQLVCKIAHGQFFSLSWSLWAQRTGF